MGIPSYFSHIVKQHRSIIRNFIKGKDKIDNLYLDSNSIIYDAFNNNNNLDEPQLINAVCDKLIYYIKLIVIMCHFCLISHVYIFIPSFLKFLTNNYHFTVWLASFFIYVAIPGPIFKWLGLV